MKYFTSDWHIGDERFDLFYRPFLSVIEQDLYIINNIIDKITADDTLYVIGDIVYDDKSIEALSLLPACEKILIKGNYDKEDKLNKYFDLIVEEDWIEIGGHEVYLNHYPIKCKEHMSLTDKTDFAITGHIHGLWKVQRNMINVSVDAWHFKPVSEDEILFCYNAMLNYYDENVFPYGN